MDLNYFNFLHKWFYPAAIRKLNTEKQVLYLTFDDGPTPVVTEFVLDTLNRFNIKATFFCIGKNIATHPELFKRIRSEGHSIGNHTYHHLNGKETSLTDYLADVEECQKLTGTRLFRPPYGRLNKHQYRALKENYRLIMWDVLSMDYNKKLSNSVCLNRVIKHSDNGSIIVFHDSEKAYKNVYFTLPIIIEYFLKREYTFEAIPENF